MRTAIIVALASACALLSTACDEGAQPGSVGDATVSLTIAPLSYQDASDACYALAVYDASYDATNPTAGRVWQQASLCGSSFGFDAEISYVGPCVGGESNTVTLVLENLYESPATYPNGAPLAATDYVNPCPASAPCARSFPCVENADVAVDFDITVMRRAKQGFFDIAVNFEDIFCSAKADCLDYGFLHNPRRDDSARDDTVVVALACTGGDGENTSLHMDDLVITCDPVDDRVVGDAVAARVDPSRGEGNLYPYTLPTTGRTLHVPTSSVPDGMAPRLADDAPDGFGGSSWRGIGPIDAQTGHWTYKSNWHARYQLDGDYLSALFPEHAADLTIADIAEISYWTKRPDGAPSGRDWWVMVYTRKIGDETTPQCDTSGAPQPCNDGTWFHRRFVNNYGAHGETRAWTRYSTDAGMTFRRNSIAGSTLQSWSDVVATNGTYLVDMISVQTDSGWYKEGWDGLVDGLEIRLTDGTVGRVDFGSALFQAQVTMGAELLDNAATGASANKVYWTVALGLDTSHGIGSGRCRLTTRMTASNGGGLGWTSPGAAYPEIALDLPLTWDSDGLTCGAHGLDAIGQGTVITTGYSSDAAYERCLRGRFSTSQPPAFCAPSAN